MGIWFCNIFLFLLIANFWGCHKIWGILHFLFFRPSYFLWSFIFELILIWACFPLWVIFILRLFLYSLWMLSFFWSSSLLLGSSSFILVNFHSNCTKKWKIISPDGYWCFQMKSSFVILRSATLLRDILHTHILEAASYKIEWGEVSERQSFDR